MLGRLSLVLAAAGARLAAAEADVSYLPPAFAVLYPRGDGEGDPLIPGMEEIRNIAKEWQAEIPAGAEGKTTLCENIYEALTTAADAPHDVFNGLRLFATAMKKAADSSDVAAMDKALNLKDKFSKALERIADKVRQQMIQEKVLQQKRKEAAEAAAAAAEEVDDDVDMDDSDDDLDGDHDEF